MTNEEVNQIEDSLRIIEAIVEKQGQRICSDQTKRQDWDYCNNYLAKVADLIHDAWRFRYMDEED